ncbi:ABC transporter substrate-binding protein [Bacillus sp. PS06]|uniref:ABC transporter substrate-binding protein n=1 Tax=Bacillus sp. PS06 TaxID=2764176 RepID=UPI001782006D|nr:ABC transporter substrate-binding protein [Bacillus sp. PS06]MBD8069065.1 extracellular solute-binding protein [Bacillus sp. PS06]
MVLNKKLLVGLLSLIMFLALVGCKNDSASTDEKDKESEGGTTENDTSPFTFTYFNAGSPGKDIQSTETKIGKIFEEQTGVTVKMEFLVGDINTKIGTMIASGQYPDVLVPDTAIDKILEAEAFIPLNDLIDEHAPNLKKLYEPYLERMKADDGNIYFIPFNASQGYIPNPNIDQGAFFMQRGVLKEFDYPEVKTLDQYFELLEKYYEKYPEVDGASTIPFTALTYDWRFFSTTNVPNHLAGYPNDGEVMVDMETHEAKVYAATDYEKRWLQKLNEANAKGLFDKEAFVANYDEYLAKLASGRVLGFFDYGWQIGQAETALKEAGDDDKRFIALPVTFDESIKDQYIDPPSFVNNRGVGITTSAKDPVRIMKFLDNMAKEENQKLIMWGIEGETYESDNGRFYRTDEQINLTSNQEFREEFGFAQFEYYWPRGNGLFSDGNAWEPRRQPEVAQAAYTEGDLAILEKYNAKVFADLFAEPEDRPWYPAWSAELEQGSPAQIYIQKKTDLQRLYYPKLVLEGNFEELWAEYVAEHDKLGAEEYEKTMTENVKKLVEQNQ